LRPGQVSVSQRRAGHVNRCSNCRINNHFCVCAHLNPFEIETNISLIVHVSELKLTSNTAQFVEKLLPKQAKIFIRGRVNETFEADPLLARPGRALFLFPDEESQEINEDFKAKYPGPYHLIVPDGNWNQAKKVKKREPKFDEIPTVKLPSGLIAEYKLRKAPRPDWVSTFEAAAYAIGALEDKNPQVHMMSFFRKWVQATLDSRSGNFNLIRADESED
jgi:DTW domain-containing protein YfiP